jgi:hypothetical protein
MDYEDKNGGRTANKRTPVNRRTVDLRGYPDLVVIYLGMRVSSLRGVATLLRTGKRIGQAVDAKPDGLLLHENFLFSVLPPHLGMRQYWRDFDALENWSRSLPHQQWWKEFLRDTGGTGFWHETYFMRGGIEAVYDDIPVNLGLTSFAPTVPARGRMFSARDRLLPGTNSSSATPPALTETDLYK